MAGFGGFKVISFDYRTPPDFFYPTAMDDAMAVWKDIVRTHDHKRLAIFGSSTGGAMRLAMVLRAKDEKLPRPAAIAPGTPWSDIDKIGDSYDTNEWVDNVSVTWHGWLGHAAKLLANGTDLKNPYISPIYGEFKGFPPTILLGNARPVPQRHGPHRSPAAPASLPSSMSMRGSRTPNTSSMSTLPRPGKPLQTSRDFLTSTSQNRAASSSGLTRPSTSPLIIKGKNGWPHRVGQTSGECAP